jgi:hypothetical protein
VANNEQRTLWEKRLAEHETSGQSITAWCKENSIKDNQFYYWRKKLRGNQEENSQPIRWLPLGIGKTKLPPDRITIHVGQVAIEISKPFDPQLLRQVVKVLLTI